MDSLEKRVQDQVSAEDRSSVQIWFDAYAPRKDWTWAVRCVIGTKGTRRKWGSFNGETLSEALRNALPENREDKP